MNDDPASPIPLFDGEPSDTRERIMLATFRTLNEYGFPGLSIQRIADEADLSKSSFYHFFDDKHDLLLAFLDTVLEQFGTPLEQIDADSPTEALWAHVDFALYGIGQGPLGGDSMAVDVGSGRPYVELRSQGAYDEAYRERFTTIDATFRERLATLVERGIETGEFREVDPERTAEFLLTVMLGGLFRRATSDAVDIDAVRAELEAVLQARLLAD